jgi:hypothetical protein
MLVVMFVVVSGHVLLRHCGRAANGRQRPDVMTPS